LDTPQFYSMNPSSPPFNKCWLPIMHFDMSWKPEMNKIDRSFTCLREFTVQWGKWTSQQAIPSLVRAMYGKTSLSFSPNLPSPKKPET
jgi:hypothetical protein